MIPKRRLRPVVRVREAIKSVLPKLYGKPTGGMRTNYSVDGRPVIFLHNPKTGGNSIAPLLGVKRLSHSYASTHLSEASWLNSVSVVAVRDPFERFLSGYYSHILRPEKNGLVKEYGPDIKKIDPFEYLAVIDVNQKGGGPQTNWSDYPSATKPRADIVLKFEDIQNWIKTLKAHGIDLGEQSIPHANKSERAKSNHLERLNLTPDEFLRLETTVRDHYGADAIAFGYTTEPVTFKAI